MDFFNRFLCASRLIVPAVLVCWVTVCLLCLPDVKAETDGLEETCRLISRKLASVSFDDCRDGGFRVSGGFSVQGTPILVKEYPPLPERRIPQARVLVVGGTHGDEYSSISIVFKWIQILDVHHSGLFHWIFVPLLNPDGLLKDQSTRTNARGVDINRNMPSELWREVGYQRWLDVAAGNPRYYPGPCPGSEPETAFLVELVSRFKPHAIISVHSPLCLVDHDGPGIPVKALGDLGLKRLGNFPGTLGNYAGAHMGIPVLTLELPSSARLPSPVEISAIWRDMVRWLIDTVPVEWGPEEIRAHVDGPQLEKEFFGK